MDQHSSRRCGGSTGRSPSGWGRSTTSTWPRGRPLAQARLLWEIGPGGAEVAALRARLGLDSGYLSRLLRTLESDGLVTVGPADQVGGDGRVRVATLTDAGRAEWTELDQRSDDFARSILEPLTEQRRERLVAAMAEVNGCSSGRW